MFYNQFLPGGTGGDIIKSYLLLKETDEESRRAARGGFRPADRAGRAGHHHRRPGQFAVSFAVENTRNQPFARVLLFLLGCSIALLITSFVISGFNLFHFFRTNFLAAKN